jgi:hypothetical protein
MKVRIGGVMVVAIATLRVFGGCSSDNSAVNADAGDDVLPVTLGTGGTIDARPDLAADVAVDRSSSGSGGAPGTGGTGAGAGIGGAGIGGAIGMGGALGTGGAVDAGGDTGVDVGAAGGAPGTGGAAVADAGSGGNDGGGGATSQTDGSIASDGPIDAPAATLNQIWSTILSVATAQTSPGCINCHDGSDSSIPNYTSTATTYATWVGVPSTSCAGIRVTAGNAETSVLVNKLRAKPNLGLGVAVCGGDPMPVGTNRSITLDQLHMIENWINAGALNN